MQAKVPSLVAKYKEKDIDLKKLASINLLKIGRKEVKKHVEFINTPSACWKYSIIIIYLSIAK